MVLPGFGGASFSPNFLRSDRIYVYWIMLQKFSNRILALEGWAKQWWKLYQILFSLMPDIFI